MDFTFRTLKTITATQLHKRPRGQQFIEKQVYYYSGDILRCSEKKKLRSLKSYFGRDAEKKKYMYTLGPYFTK